MQGRSRWLTLAGTLMLAAGCRSEITATATQPSATLTVTSAPATAETATAPRPTDQLSGSATLRPTQVQLTSTPTSIPTPIPLPTALPVVYAEGALPIQGIVRIGIGYHEVTARSPNEDLLAIGTTTGVYVFDTRQMTQLWEVFTRSPVTELEWSPDGGYLAAALLEWGNVLVWKPDSPEVVHRLEHQGTVESLEWSPDGTKVAVGLNTHSQENPLAENATAVWNLSDSTLELVVRPPAGIELPHGERAAVDVGWTPDGSRLATIIGYLEVGLFDSTTGHLLSVIRQRQCGHCAVQHLSFSPDGTKLATYTGVSGPPDAPGGDSRVYIWDVATNELLFELPHDVPNAPGAYVAVDADWSEDGRTITTRAGGAWKPDPTYGQPWEPTPIQTRLWDANTGELLAELPNDQGAEPPSDRPESGVFAIPNEVFVVWPPDANSATYSISSSYFTDTFLWSPDSMQVASVPEAGSGAPIAVWDTVSGQMTGTAEPSTVGEWIVAVDFISDWRRLKSFGESTSVSDPAGRLSATWQSIYVEPYGERVDSTITVREAGSGIVLHRILEERATVYNVAFSPDSQFLAVGHRPATRGQWQPSVTHIDETTVTIYAMQTGALVGTLRGHAGTILALMWSPDSRVLATQSTDGTIVLWSIHP